MASSKIKILASFIRALALAILCFCPPLTFIPLSPTIVSNCLGNIFVSVANEYHGCIAAFNGPSFDYFGDVVHIRWSLESAHNSFCATIHDLNEIQIISKEEFLDAYNECANKAKNEFIKAISKTPIKKTTTQYKYEEDRYDVKE